jgi:L-histidine N-alpha-methyltransferase
MPTFARDVREGLTRPGQRTVPSMYLYDELGTALFEAITLLPEYGLTRADERLLQRHAGAIVDELSGSFLVAELGSGTGRKTRWILEALARREPVRYYPIDISPTALARCRQELAGLDAVSIIDLEHSYVEGVQQAVTRRRDGQRVLLLFLGSTIGNFERPAAAAFLREIRGCLAPGDALLLGTDLVKAPPVMLAAYDDPTGVTAAFNRNLLARMNRDLGANFDLRCWDHEARWNAAERRIEMHLKSRAQQTVAIPIVGVNCAFAAGETIWTESSHKFDLEEVPCLAERAGFRHQAQWVDGEWPFAESLWVAA